MEFLPAPPVHYHPCIDEQNGGITVPEEGAKKRPALRFRISEDWLAVIVGFVLIALVYLGVLTHVPW
ncbi:MAG: hypothetical protein C4309_07295 [Chloroflexota bacterium]